MRNNSRVGNRLALFLSIVLLVAITIGCGNAAPGQERSNGNSMQNEREVERAAADRSKNALSEELAELADSGVAPAALGVVAYFEAKGATSEALNAATEKLAASGDPMAMMAFLPISFADLTILPLTMLSMLPETGKNIWEGELMMLVTGSGRIEQKGDISEFTLKLQDSGEGADYTEITGKYDRSKDSMRAEFWQNNQLSHVFEYSTSGNGYVSQLYSNTEDETTWLKHAFTGTSLYSGIVPANGEPESIYQKSPAINEEFVKNESLMLVLNDGVGYAILDGKRSVIE